MALPGAAVARPAYRGPNVILIRFGGGVRRQEVLDPARTYAPGFLRDLAPRGTLYTKMEITTDPGIDTSHGQGTLNLLIGRYAHYEDVHGRLLGERFEAASPTLFEMLRKQYDVPPHETLIVNHENRVDEEFYAFSNHEAFGPRYRCNVLSLYRFKTFLLRRQIAEGELDEAELVAKRKALAELEAVDLRAQNDEGQGPEIDAFWERWRTHYGESGLVNPRGDQLLTELAVRAMRELSPRFLLVNYNDPDYVHWGNASHYTRAISIIDQGIQRLVETAAMLPAYRDDTVFAIAPDCGRDDNRFMAIPYQHHFNSRSSREIFALFFGPGITQGAVIDRPVQQIAVAPTLGRVMGFATPTADEAPLREVFA